jgi:alanine racemase
MALPKPKKDASTLRVLRPRRAAPADAARATRAEIDLARVRYNLRELQACLAADAHGKPAALWAVLKADAYGHGAAQIGRTLEQAGVDGLCVALLEEGIELRNAGVTCPVLVMGGYYGRHRDGVEALIESQLTPVVYDVEQISNIAGVLRFMHGDEATLGVHLKIDTGMGRLGVRESGLDAVIQALRGHEQLQVDGLMTHLACADGDDLTHTRQQLADFARISQRLERASITPRVRHAANSAAMLRLPQAHLDLVRPGIALFGVHPCPSQQAHTARVPKLKPVMRVLSEVVALRDLSPGEAIGYGHTWRARRPTRIATIPMGYADGLDRALSNCGNILIHGKRAPIVASVSMDLTMVDVTDHPNVCVCDEAVVLGHQRGPLGEATITADELAKETSTIAWECLTSISRRVPRFFRNP